MHVALWIVQGLLAAAFGVAGLAKATRPRDDLQSQMAWIEDVTDGTLRLVGIAELAAALGLILPAATGIAPVLTPLAAIGLAVVMVLAAGLHVRRREPQAIAINTLLFAAAVFVAWGRFGPHTF